MSGGHLKLFAELKLRQVTLLLFVELCLFLSRAAEDPDLLLLHLFGNAGSS